MKEKITSLEQEALEFIHQLQSAYLERRDLATMLSDLEPAATWLGDRPYEICEDPKQVETALIEEFQEYPGRFTLTESSLRTHELSKDICVVYGEFLTRPQSPAATELRNCLTAICIRTPSGMKLSHLHLSHPKSEHTPRHTEGRKIPTADPEALRIRSDEAACALKERALEVAHHVETFLDDAARILKERERELCGLIENIPGGILQCRYDKDFPIISITNSFLSLTGYTKKDLHDRFQSHFTDLIFPEDRQMVWSACKERLVCGNTLELEYRIRRKDGSLFWIFDKRKLVLQPDGSKTCYCLLLDHNRRASDSSAHIISRNIQG